jgi:hypothetical protein
MRALLLVFGPSKLSKITEYQLNELNSFITNNSKVGAFLSYFPLTVLYN